MLTMVVSTCRIETTLTGRGFIDIAIAVSHHRGDNRDPRIRRNDAIANGTRRLYRSRCFTPYFKQDNFTISPLHVGLSRALPQRVLR